MTQRAQELQQKVHSILVSSGLRKTTFKPVKVVQKKRTLQATISLEDYVLLVLAHLEAVLEKKVPPVLTIRFDDRVTETFSVTSIWPPMERSTSLRSRRGLVVLELDTQDLLLGTHPFIRMQEVVEKRTFAITFLQCPVAPLFPRWQKACQDLTWESELQGTEVAVDQAFRWAPEVLTALNNLGSGTATDADKEVYRAVYLPQIAGMQMLEEFSSLQLEKIAQLRTKNPRQFILGRLDDYERLLLTKVEARRAHFLLASKAGFGSKPNSELQTENFPGDFLPPGQWFASNAPIDQLMDGPRVSLTESSTMEGGPLPSVNGRTEGQMKGFYANLGCREAWVPTGVLGGRTYIAFLIGDYVILDTVTAGNAIYVLRVSGGEGHWADDARRSKREVLSSSVRFVVRIFHTANWMERLRGFLSKAE